jgi:plasmid replication initiation protein
MFFMQETIETDPHNTLLLDRDVRVSNRLIESEYSLGPLQNRMVRLIASQISLADTVLLEYEFTLKELSYALGLQNCKDKYRIIKNLTYSLTGAVIEYISMFNEQPALVQVAWFKDCVYVENKVIISINSKLKPYYIDIQKGGNFTRYPYKSISPLNGKYSVRFYELLRSESWKINKDLGHWSYTISIEDIKRYFTLPTKILPANIKRDIVDMSCREISKETDINVNATPIYFHKNGKRCTNAFHFDCYFKSVSDYLTSHRKVDCDETKPLTASQEALYNIYYVEELNLLNSENTSAIFSEDARKTTARERALLRLKQ